MKAVKFLKILIFLCLLLSIIVYTDSRPFMMSLGQSLSGVFYSIYKWVDNTPELNQTTVKRRSPALASKYGQSVDPHNRNH